MTAPIPLRKLSPSDDLAEAQRRLDEIALREVRHLETLAYDLVEWAERIATADAVKGVGIREIARQIVTSVRPRALNLTALIERSRT